MEVRTKNDADWTWFSQVADSGKGLSELMKNHSQITGKYVVFSRNREKLVEIAKREIRENGFQLAKVPRRGKNVGADYVLCLYYKNDSRKHELEERYDGAEGVRYRYWKSDKDTLAGKYSQEFRRELERTNHSTFRIQLRLDHSSPELQRDEFESARLPKMQRNPYHEHTSSGKHFHN